MKSLDHQQLEYYLHFDPLQDNGSIVRRIDLASGGEHSARVSIDDHDFKHRIQQQFPSVIADVIDLAVAIHASDRLTSQDQRQRQIQLRVVLPVRHPEILNQSALNEQLCHLLEWTTGKHWSFEFERRCQAGRSVENQALLCSSEPDVDEVSLWSGGLDALAGLYSRLKQSPAKSYALFGSGSNDNTHKRQQDVYHSLQDLFPSRLDLCRVPIRFDQSNHLKGTSKNLSFARTNQRDPLQQLEWMGPKATPGPIFRGALKKNPSRARGIVFMLLGSAYSYLRGLRVLHVYENGIGAINLPYRKSAVGLDHSRSVHPETLLGVGLLMSELIGDSFKVRNPFLFHTKAEMIKLLAEDAQTDLVSLTNSCDSPHRKSKEPTQCGYCSSCLLRKQALAASQLDDKTEYIVPHGNPPAENIRLYLASMLAQVATFRERLKPSNYAANPWQALTQRFPELNDIADRTHADENMTLLQMRHQLIRLFHTYACEWNTVEQSLFEQFEAHINGDLGIHESQHPILQGSLLR